MNDDKECESSSRALYQRYRQLMKPAPTQTTDAAVLYKDNLQRSETHENQLDRIMEAVKCAERKSKIATLPVRLPLLHRVIDPLQGLVLPAMAACLLIIVATFFIGNEPNVSVQRLVSLPASLTDVSDFITPVEPAQLSLMHRDYPQQQLFLLGVSTTQVVLVSDQKQRLQFIASQLDMLSEHPDFIANLNEHSQAWRSELVTEQGVEQAIGQLHHTLEQSQHVLIEWYRLGQLIESLRIALLVAEIRGDNTALREVQSLLLTHDVGSLNSTVVPKLADVTDEIMGLGAKGDALTRSDRRRLLRLTEQVNALLQ